MKQPRISKSRAKSADIKACVHHLGLVQELRQVAASRTNHVVEIRDKVFVLDAGEVCEDARQEFVHLVSFRHRHLQEGKRLRHSLIHVRREVHAMRTHEPRRKVGCSALFCRLNCRLVQLLDDALTGRRDSLRVATKGELWTAGRSHGVGKRVAVVPVERDVSGRPIVWNSDQAATRDVLDLHRRHVNRGMIGVLSKDGVKIGRLFVIPVTTLDVPVGHNTRLRTRMRHDQTLHRLNRSRVHVADVVAPEEPVAF